MWTTVGEDVLLDIPLAANKKMAFLSLSPQSLNGLMYLLRDLEHVLEHYYCTCSIAHCHFFG